MQLNHGYVAIVDDEDYQWVMLSRWYVVIRNGKVEGVVTWDQNRAFPLANFVMRQHSVRLDHVDRDPLNNTKINLRVATNSQNSCNRTRKDSFNGWKGVHPVYSRKSTRYQARVSLNGVTYNLGCFATPREAAEAYNKGALRLHGEFACLNKFTDNESDVHASAEGNKTTVTESN